MDFNEDDIQRAIALSLQDSQGKPNHTSHATTATPVDDEEGYEDEDDLLHAQKTQEAMAMSRAESKVQLEGSSNTNNFLSERAQLERERLERQNKRVRREDDSSENIMQASAPAAKRPNTASSSRQQSTATTTQQQQDELFWDGEARPTANQHCHPRKDGKKTFRISEIIGKKEDLAFAIVSTFALELSWLYSFFDPSVPVILVTGPEGNREPGVKNVLPNWVRAFPYVPDWGTMHMKFMLLFYKDGRLRVAITTANLIAYDWRDIDNYAWVQDVRKRADPKDGTKDPESFPVLFQDVLRAVNVRAALDVMIRQDKRVLPLQKIDDLSRLWDFSKVKAQLVASLVGKHEGWPKVILTGHTRLMKAVRSLGLKVPDSKTLHLECQGSSIGSYTSHWLNEFYWSAKGSGNGWLDKPKKKREKLPLPSIKILFPSKTTVKESKLGEAGGGTMFCRRSQWKGATYPRDLFHDSKSKGGPVLMHTKMILGLLRDKPVHPDTIVLDSDTEDDEEEEDNSRPIGWVYVGSHNFTPTAWGNLSGSDFDPTMNLKSFEIGVVLPLRNNEELDRIVPWERPPLAYNSNGLEPWIQDESPVLQKQRMLEAQAAAYLQSLSS